jgi:hypothetical protein
VRDAPTFRVMGLLAGTAASIVCLLPVAGAAERVADVHVARVVECHTFASYPNIQISSARNMSCRAARRELRRYKRPIDRRFRTPGGFSCRQVSGGALGGQWRCVRGSRAFRFEFGD